MALTINHNFQSEFTQLNLNKTQMTMNSSLEKLSSGYRINSAKDDASGLFIADQLKLVADALDQGSRNALTGISTAQIAETSLSQVFDKLKDMYTKAQDAANDVNDPAARQALQTDIQQLSSAIDTIAKTSEYNGLNLLDGTFTNKSIHYGARADQTTTISIQSARATDLGANVVSGTGATASAGGDNDLATLIAASAGYEYDSADSDVFSVANVDLSAAFTDGDVVDVKTMADAVNNDSTLQALGVSATAANSSTADSEFSNITVAGADTLDIALYVGTDGGTADFTVSYTGGDTVTLSDLVSQVNTAASSAGLSLTAKAENNKLVLETDGESISMQVTATGGAAAGSTTVDMSTLVEGATGTVVADTNSTADNGSAIKVGDLSLVGAEGYAYDFTGISTGVGTAAASGNATTYNLNSIDVTTNSGAELALKILDVAIGTVDSQRADLGSKQIQFQALIDNNDFAATQTREAESRIRNVDFAKEMSEFTLQQTLMQSGMAMLSQANQIPSMVLQLLR